MSDLTTATAEVLDAATWTPRGTFGLAFLGVGLIAHAAILAGTWPAWAVTTAALAVVAQIAVGFVRCARKVAR